MISFTKSDLKWTSVLSVIIFSALTLFFSDFSGISDGITRIGFPLVFMQDTGGKCIDCQNIKWFKIFYLFADLLLSCLIALVFVKFFSKSR